MTPTSPVRVALLGYGYAGRTFHAPLIAAEPRLALTMVASRDAAKVHADLPGVSVGDAAAAVASDVDLVVIATPNDTHAPLARAALTAGKHVVVDKPFALDLAEARDLAGLADERGRLLAVFHNRRWDSDFLSLAAAIGRGAIGELRHLQSRIDRFRPAVRDRWRERAGPGGGLWYDLGPHLVDQALLLAGLPDRVRASLARLRPGAETDDWAEVILEVGERRVTLGASMLVAGGTTRFAAHGERGSLIKRGADLQEAQLLAGMRPGAPGWGVDPDPLLAFDATGGERVTTALAGDQRQFYAGVAAALLDGAANPVPPIQALAVMAVLDAASEAARTGRSVAPALTDRERAAHAASRSAA